MAGSIEPLTAIVEDFLRRKQGGFGGTPEEFLAERGGAADPDTAEMLRILAGLKDRPAQGGELGPYRIERELGRGAQGVVCLAEDRRLGRKVALKVLAPHAAFGTELQGVLDAAGLAETIGAVRRFRREVEAAARLDHPWICPVYEAGAHGGSQFIAMRYVEGHTLAQLIAQARGPAPTPSSSPRSSVVRLPEPDPSSTETAAPALPVRGVRVDVERVCLLVERVARALHTAHEKGLVHRDIKPGNIMVTGPGSPVVLDFGLARDVESGDLTRTGTLLGTPVYMSPEQIAAKPADRRTDVYSLGVVLFECLALRRPFEAATLQALCHEILTREPPKLRRLNPAVPFELGVVVETALSKELERRYRTALDLAEDLRRVRERLPIRARPPGPLLRLRRWAERNPTLAVAVAAIFVLLVSGLAVTSHLLRKTSQALVETERERDAKDRALRRTRALALAGAAGAELDADPQLSLLLAREAARAELLPEVVTRLHDAINRPNPVVILRHANAVRGVAFSPAGDLLLTASGSVAQTWDLSWNPVRAFRGHTVQITSVSFARGGEAILTTSADRTARVFDLAGNTLAVLRGHGDTVEGASFSPDGRKVVTASRDRTARLWTAEGEALRTLAGHEGVVWSAAFFPDGERVLTGSDDCTLRVWDLEGHEVAKWERGVPCSRVVFSRAGDRILCVGGRASSILDLEGREIARLPPGNMGGCFSPDGERVIVGTTVFDAMGEKVDGPLGHATAISDAAFSPDGRLVATGSFDGGARVWEPGRAESTVFRGHTGAIPGVEFSPRGDRVLTACLDGTARTWRLDGTPEITLPHGTNVNFAVYSPQGDRVLTGGADATPRLWRIDGTQIAVLEGHGARVVNGDLSPDGRWIATVGEDATARLWDAEGRPVRSYRHPHAWVKCVVFSPDSKRILTACRDNLARVWDLDGKLLFSMRHADHITRAVFSPTGQHIATAAINPPHARVWSADGRLVATCRGHSSNVLDVAFSSDGRRVVTASSDGTARVWDLDGTELAVLRGTGTTMSAAFSPDGRFVVTGHMEGTARLWHTDDAELLRVADSRIARDFTRDERLRFAELLGAENQHALDAEKLIEGLVAELLLAGDVAERVRSDATLDAGVRTHALRLAAGLRDDADRLNQRARALVRTQGKDARRALRWAERAAELAPGDGTILSTLGVAQYRTEAHEAALATLRRCREINGPTVEDLSFLALACARLGRDAEARGYIEEARKVVAAGKPTPEQRRVLKEAEAGVR